MAKRMSLKEAQSTLTSTGAITIQNEDGKWTARYSGNKHLLKTFENGYDVVHAAMYLTESHTTESVPEVLKADNYKSWFSDRQEKAASQWRSTTRKERDDFFQALTDIFMAKEEDRDEKIKHYLGVYGKED